MAFENVDVTSLRNALTSCKNSINYNTSKELIDSVSSSVWQTSSQKKLNKSLKALTNTRYKELENKLNDYIEAVSYIEQYKSYENENKTLQNKYNSLNNSLYKNEQYTVTSTDANGNEVTETRVRTVKDTGVESSMNSISNQINSNKSEMNTLKNKVANKI